MGKFWQSYSKNKKWTFWDTVYKSYKIEQSADDISSFSSGLWSAVN